MLSYSFKSGATLTFTFYSRVFTPGHVDTLPVGFLKVLKTFISDTKYHHVNMSDINT